jgi:nicotinamide mononucleotide (NMN) deamidase PncC
MLAKRARERMGATWGIAETGATGPTGNRYGDAAGHTCIAVSGPVERAITLETGSADRRANMDAFAKRALELLSEVISAAR